MDAPNASGGGSAEMADATSGVIEEVEISEEKSEEINNEEQEQNQE